MKKVFLVLMLMGVILSCSINDDEGQDVNFEFVSITNADLPDTLIFGNRYTFPITSEVSDCSTYYGLRVDPQDSIRFVAAVNTVREGVDCSGTTDTIVNNLDFEVIYNYTYVFKFLTGVNANGENTYITKNIPVRER
ncbi:MAG: hypothetical protein WA951_08985 [Leeuwenhoekiella sp.]